MSEYQRLKDQADESVRITCETIAEKIINAIVSGKMFKASCPKCESDSCVVVWSSTAKEQISSIVAECKPSKGGMRIGPDSANRNTVPVSAVP